MTCEVRACVYKASELNDALKAIPVSTNRVGDQRDDIHCASPRGRLCLFKGYLNVDPSDMRWLPINDRDLT